MMGVNSAADLVTSVTCNLVILILLKSERLHLKETTYPAYGDAAAWTKMVFLERSHVWAPTLS